MKIFDIYNRYRKTYKNTLSVMWNLYRKNDVIDVILRDGTQEKLPPELTFVLSKRNGEDINKKSINDLKILYDSWVEALNL